MSKHLTFKVVLQKIMDDGYYGLRDNPKVSDLFEGLRELFERWRDHQNKADNQLWEDIADDGERRGLSRRQSYFGIAAIAFQANTLDGYPQNPENLSPKVLREESERLSGLAECAAKLADYYGNDGIMADENLARRLSDEERRFRLRSSLVLENLPAASRQSHGKKFARKHLSFMRSLAHGMQREFGRPYYEACAVLTSIAYPQIKEVSGEEVRLACRAKRGTGKLSSK